MILGAGFVQKMPAIGLATNRWVINNQAIPA